MAVNKVPMNIKVSNHAEPTGIFHRYEMKEVPCLIVEEKVSIVPKYVTPLTTTGMKRYDYYAIICYNLC